jgi:hypothetical protein
LICESTTFAMSSSYPLSSDRIGLKYVLFAAVDKNFRTRVSAKRQL